MCVVNVSIICWDEQLPTTVQAFEVFLAIETSAAQAMAYRNPYLKPVPGCTIARIYHFEDPWMAAYITIPEKDSDGLPGGHATITAFRLRNRNMTEENTTYDMKLVPAKVSFACCQAVRNSLGIFLQTLRYGM